MNYKGIEIRAAEGLHEDCMELVQRYFPKGSKVIDLAAGAGAFSERLADEGYDLTANDIDDKNWAGTGRIHKLTLDLNESLELSLPDTSYSGVVAMEVIEHLHNPVKLLKDCKRLVADGGYILLSTPNVMDIESRLIFLRSGYLFHFSPKSFYATGHQAILPYWLLEIFFEEIGLEVVERHFNGKLTVPKSASGLKGLIRRSAIVLIKLFIKERNPEVLNSNYIVYLLRSKTEKVS